MTKNRKRQKAFLRSAKPPENLMTIAGTEKNTINNDEYPRITQKVLLKVGKAYCPVCDQEQDVLRDGKHSFVVYFEPHDLPGKSKECPNSEGPVYKDTIIFS